MPVQSELPGDRYTKQAAIRADLDVARITGDDLADDQRGLTGPHVGYVQSG